MSNISLYYFFPRQMGLDDDRPFELDAADAIPYLTEEDMSPRRMAKMTEEWMRGAGDMYDFVRDGDQLLSLHGSLPLADEVSARVLPSNTQYSRSRAGVICNIIV